MMHVPTETSVTVEPTIEQMAEVCELKLTGNPDVADVLTANGALPNATFESVPNVIVCAA